MILKIIMNFVILRATKIVARFFIAWTRFL